MPGHLSKELAAFQALTRLMDDGARCAELFQEAGMRLPEPLARLLSDLPVSKQEVSRPSLPGPKIPARPAGAGADWVWVPTDGLGCTNLVLALLNKNGTMRPRDLTLAALEIDPTASAGTISNVGTRLSGKRIFRSNEGWGLMDAAKGPMLNGSYCWGPAAGFKKQELAAHRRECIVYILNVRGDGLQQMQIVHELEGREWMHAPLSKDLVKADLASLQAQNRVRRIGNSKKWRAVAE